MAMVRIDRQQCREGALPPVCIVCGELAEETEPVWHCFVRIPLAVWLALIVCGVIPFIVLLVIFSRKRWVHTPLCDEHRYYWQVRLAMKIGAITSPFGLFVSPLLLPGVDVPDELLALSAVAVIAFVIAAIVISYRSVRALTIEDHNFIVGNVSERFREAMLQQRDRAFYDPEFGYQRGTLVHDDDEEAV